MPQNDSVAPDGLRELLTALRDMLDVPLPRDWAKDESVFHDLGQGRRIQAAGVIDGMLAAADITGSVDLKLSARTIRNLTDKAPVTYETRS